MACFLGRTGFLASMCTSDSGYVATSGYVHQ